MGLTIHYSLKALGSDAHSRRQTRSVAREVGLDDAVVQPAKFNLPHIHTGRRTDPVMPFPIPDRRLVIVAGDCQDRPESLDGATPLRVACDRAVGLCLEHDRPKVAGLAW